MGFVVVMNVVQSVATARARLLSLGNERDMAETSISRTTLHVG